MSKPRVSQLAQTAATNDQAVVWDNAAGLWLPKSVVRPTLIDAKGDLLAGTANDTIDRLAVGSDGQVLTADSTQTAGVKWAASLADPTTTKGDLLARSTSALTRLGIGPDGQVLTADSTQTLGVKWAAASGGYADPLTTKGDLVARSSTTTTRLAVGSDGQVLTADSASADGVKWSSTAAAFNPSPVDDPANFGTNLGFDQEFSASSSSPPSGWSWVNQGTATYLEAYGAGAISHPGAAANDVKGLAQTIPSAASFLATLKFSMFSIDNSNTIAGMMLRDSVSGKVITWGYRTGRTIELDYWTNPTTFNSAFDQFTVIAEPHYCRIRKNSSTSWDFGFSPDGVAWVDIDLARNISTFMTPDQIGVFCFRSTTSAAAFAAHWFRIR